MALYKNTLEIVDQKRVSKIEVLYKIHEYNMLTPEAIVYAELIAACNYHGAYRAYQRILETFIRPLLVRSPRGYQQYIDRHNKWTPITQKRPRDARKRRQEQKVSFVVTSIHKILIKVKCPQFLVVMSKVLVRMRLQHQ